MKKTGLCTPGLVRFLMHVLLNICLANPLNSDRKENLNPLNSDRKEGGRGILVYPSIDTLGNWAAVRCTRK